MFIGFLPTKKSRIIEIVNKFEYLETTLILFETAKRLKKTLKIFYKATPIIMPYFGGLGVAARVALYEEC